MIYFFMNTISLQPVNKFLKPNTRDNKGKKNFLSMPGFQVCMYMHKIYCSYVNGLDPVCS